MAPQVVSADFLFLAVNATFLLRGISAWNGTVEALLLAPWKGQFADGTPLRTISFGYVGVIKMNEGLAKIFEMKPDMKTVPFGNALGSWTFVVADPELKDLENNMWSSSSRLIVNENGSLQVESRIWKVSADEVMN